MSRQASCTDPKISVFLTVAVLSV